MRRERFQQKHSLMMRKSILESFLVKDERGDSIPGLVMQTSMIELQFQIKLQVDISIWLRSCLEELSVPVKGLVVILKH